MNISNSVEEGSEVLRARTIVIGDHNVGKTTLIRNFIRGESTDSPPTGKPVPDVSEKAWVLADGRTVKMTILDTGGLERFRSLTSSFYRGIHGCVIVFSVGQLSSFDSVADWMRDLCQYTEDQTRISTILVGTTHKSCSRTISFDKAYQLAKHLGMPYMEIDLSEGNAAEVFQRLAAIIFEIFQRRCSIVSTQHTPLVIKSYSYKHSCCSC